MSDKFTSIEAPSGGLGEWGHISYEEALGKITCYYERQLVEAQKVLHEIVQGKVHVFHQRGPYAAANRREVPRPAEPGDQS